MLKVSWADCFSRRPISFLKHHHFLLFLRTRGLIWIGQQPPKSAVRIRLFGYTAIDCVRPGRALLPVSVRAEAWGFEPALVQLVTLS